MGLRAIAVAAAGLAGLLLTAGSETPAPDIARLKAAVEAELRHPIHIDDIRRDHAQRYTLVYSHRAGAGRASFRYVDRGWRLTQEHDAKMRLRYF